MPNRIIKESICTSDTIDNLTWFEEVLFYRLIVNCDDYGRFDARPPILKARLFPLKSDLTEEAVVEGLKVLETVGLVLLYEKDGRPYLQIRTWENHQTIRNQRSKYPDYEERNGNQLKSIEINCNQLNTKVPVIQSNPIQSNPNPNPNTRHKKALARKCGYGVYKNVLLSDTEFDKISGMENGNEAIEFLSEYIEMKGYKAKSHYLALKKWVFAALKEKSIKELEMQRREERITGKKAAPLPDWYEKYQQDLKNLPSAEKLSDEEVDKIMKETREENA